MSNRRKQQVETRSVLKVLILGDGGVGKTCIMGRFINDQFEDNSFHTIGVEFLNKDFVLTGKNYTLQIWDTAGQERFKSLRTPFYRGTDICLLVFALDDKSSFNNLSLWRQEFLHYADIQDPQSFPFIVVGNKVDLGQSSRTVNPEEIKQWCCYHGNPPYFETSAKTNVNIAEVFKESVQQWIKRETDLDVNFRAAGNTLYLTPDSQSNSQKRRYCC
ncbi:ras-related protein Rab-9B-like [Daphnia carinata]|uniref:ras-related protein Rab-9B-like n=1 Tax=Daphnia carinata TaxID=120202 RepID=UPI00257B1671|nr:ras-related protein Rab-9B-like [Daphnia carinata]